MRSDRNKVAGGRGGEDNGQIIFIQVWVTDATEVRREWVGARGTEITKGRSSGV